MFPSLDGTRQAIEHWETVIGRSKRSDIVLNFPSVSRNHAALMRDSDGMWTVTDLRSKTGTTVNRKTVEGTVPVKSGDLISVGGVQLVLLPLLQRNRRKCAVTEYAPVFGSIRH